MHSADYDAARCLSVHLAHVIKLFSPAGSHTILVFPCKPYGNIPIRGPLTGASNAGRIWKIAIFDQHIAYISERIQDQGHSYYGTPTETRERSRLTNSAISNDRVWHLTSISKSRYCMFDAKYPTTYVSQGLTPTCLISTNFFTISLTRQTRPDDMII